MGRPPIPLLKVSHRVSVKHSLPLCGAIALLAAACNSVSAPSPNEARRPLGLMTSLPIYWPETGAFGDLVREGQEKGWVRASLERSYTLDPLDVLDERTLEGFDLLVLAQPRALSPQENVALDAWVRDGGRLLLFADPMLTAHTRYPIGDRRRPQDVALLSPILAHWGLDLTFAPDQPPGEHAVSDNGLVLPVDVAGHWNALPGSPCKLSLEDIIATCVLGRGRAVIVADAAVLQEGEEGADPARGAALAELLKRAFD